MEIHFKYVKMQNESLYLSNCLNEVGPNLTCFFPLQTQSHRAGEAAGDIHKAVPATSAVKLLLFTVWFMLSQSFLSPAAPHRAHSPVSTVVLKRLIGLLRCFDNQMFFSHQK